jgi:hypothetical protein
MRPDPGHYDRAALAIMGLVLLGCVSLLSLGIFAAVSVTTYLGLHFILKNDSSQKRRGKVVMASDPSATFTSIILQVWWVFRE